MSAGAVPGTAVLASILCRDHLALASFYAEAFGFPEVDAVASPIFISLDAGRFVLGFHADEAYDLLGIAERRDQTGSRLHLTIDVGSFADVDAGADKLAELGATIVKGPFTTYYDARQVVCTDPEGNLFRISSSQPGVSDLGTGS